MADVHERIHARRQEQKAGRVKGDDPIPPVAAGTSLFDPTPEPGALGMTLLRTGWMLRGLNDEDAGLVCLVARRKT